MKGELKKITYHIHVDDDAPRIGQYMVFLGKRGILSVHLIKAVRPVKPRVVSDTAKYALQLLPQPDLLPYVVHDEDTNQVWVRGEEALPAFSMRRESKQTG